MKLQFDHQRMAVRGWGREDDHFGLLTHPAGILHIDSIVSITSGSAHQANQNSEG